MRRATHDDVDVREREIARLQAELAALRPWAEIGARVLRGKWYIQNHFMMCCHRMDWEDHSPLCEIPALKTDVEAGT